MKIVEERARQSIINQVAEFYRLGKFTPLLKRAEQITKEDFQDLQQDAFLYILQRIDKYKPEKSKLESFCFYLIKHFISNKKSKYIRRSNKYSDFLNFCLAEEELKKVDPSILLEHRYIYEIRSKEVIKMREDIKNLLFDFIVKNWTREEKEKIKAYVKKETFEPVDLYPCFGFFYWNDAECKECILNRLCALSVKSVWIPYVFDYIKEYMSEQEKKELILSIQDIFNGFQIIPLEQRPTSNNVINDKYELSRYGFRDGKVSRGAIFLIEGKNIDTAAQRLANEYSLSLEEASQYIKRQTVYFMRKRGFKVEIDRKTNEVEIKFPDKKI